LRVNDKKGGGDESKRKGQGVSISLTELFKRRQLFKEQDAKDIRVRADIIDRKMHGMINGLRRRS
jgi:hypothetical protein